jgi:hypothetical protein
MTSAKPVRVTERPSAPQATPSYSLSRPWRVVGGLGLAGVLVALSMSLSKTPMDLTALFSLPSHLGQQTKAAPGRLGQPAQPEIRLTRESIDVMLDRLDQAIRRKDVEEVLGHIASNATITIHMKQGSQLQLVTLTRGEYRTTLQMAFAFPSANDYARVGTTVSIAPDGRSAKVSFKSTETLRQARRDITVEGEETLMFKVLNDKPTIVSLEQVMPGDST